jgi:hypothetical protein
MNPRNQHTKQCLPSTWIRAFICMHTHVLHEPGKKLLHPFLLWTMDWTRKYLPSIKNNEGKHVIIFSVNVRWAMIFCALLTILEAMNEAW